MKRCVVFAVCFLVVLQITLSIQAPSGRKSRQVAFPDDDPDLDNRFLPTWLSGGRRRGNQGNQNRPGNNNQQQGGNQNRPGNNNQQQGGNNQQQGGNNQLPDGNEQLGNNQLPDGNEQLGNNQQGGQDQQWGNNQQGGGNNQQQGGNNQQQQVTSTTPAAPRPDCVQRCPVTPEYNPVCGSNRQSYTNRSRLDCARQCGVNTLQFIRMGNC